MSPKALAAIILRLTGVRLLLQAAAGLVSLYFMHRDLMMGRPGAHVRWYSSSADTPVPPGPPYVRDGAYCNACLGPRFLAMALRLTGGVILLLASRPLGRVLARNLPSE